ncbi:MAG: hypothetical protein NUV65_00405 [Candidatus Roizmanbacteria bacterium]|nr:hypothetical protein [Candidatus Roizmanbacteria bacterium]
MLNKKPLAITLCFCKQITNKHVIILSSLKNKKNIHVINEELTLYPLKKALENTFASFHNFDLTLNNLLSIIPTTTFNLLSCLVKDWKGSPFHKVIGKDNLRVIGEMPGGATRRLFDDDGATARTWWTLRKTAQMIQSNPDFKPHLTPPRREVLARVVAGPLDVDLKHWETDIHKIEKTIKHCTPQQTHLEQQIIKLKDGRSVIKASVTLGLFAYYLDIAEHVGATETEILNDYRSGPQQSSKANISGYLISSDDNDLYIGLSNKVMQNCPDDIQFPEYPGGYLQGLCAAAKLARVKMLSSTRDTPLNARMCERFRLRLNALVEDAVTQDKEDTLTLPNFRVTEFITDMLIAATVSNKLTTHMMVKYGIMDALFPGGIVHSSQGRNCLDNLAHFDPNDAFSVMRFIQDIDPTNRFQQ